MGDTETSESRRERLQYSVEVAAYLAPDDSGYFNDTEYDPNGLPPLRMSLALALETTAWMSLLTEIRSDNVDIPEPYALYARLHFWR